MALLLLVAGCTEYQVKGPDTVVPDSTLADSVPCSVCTLEGQPASTVLADPTCNHIDSVIANPFELTAGPELFVNVDWPESYGGMSAVVADFDADGVPEIAINDASFDATESRVSTFDDDGAVMWEVMDVPYGSPLTAVDLDGADGAEMLVYSCREWPNCGDGELEMRSPDTGMLWTWADGDFSLTPDAGPLVCDLYADGLPEVLVHRRMLDGLTGIPTATYEMGNIQDTASTCVDVDHDGILEFAMSGSLFSADGSVLWSIALHAGYEGASFGIQGDTDPEPEFLFVGSRGRGGFTVADTDGTVLSEVSLEIQNPDNILLSDLDGNGSAELVMVTKEWTVVAYELNGTLLWERDLGYVTWMSGWDVDADGASELLVQGLIGGEYSFEILAGSTGDVLFSTPNETRAGWPPVVADLDNDGHAEIVVAGGAPREGLLPSATIYHQVDNTWPAAGPAWPVPDYHLTNVGPAGEIPRGEPDPPSWMYNVVHARPAVDGQGVNLTPTVTQVCTDTCDDTVQIDVVVTNSGPMPANDVVVRAYVGSTVLTDVAVGRVGSGAVSEGTIVTLAASDFDRGEVRLVVDPDDGSPECDEGDNELLLADPR